MLRFFVALAICALIPLYVEGHGMVLLPANRASRWRFDESAPANYDDNGLFCGGRFVQWYENGGKCGMCGDNYADPAPRTYELGGGEFGQGVIVESYKPGSDMPVQVLVTANHFGFFTFKLCNIDKYSGESERCFDEIPLKLTNGDEKFVIDDAVRIFHLTLRLPQDVICKHCVLQWTWTTGNSWGDCETGTNELGCGEQETFRTCSDISILP